MLKNKVVNVENPELLQFFYPDYIIKNEVSKLDRDNKIIYTGSMKSKIKNYLGRNCKEFISTVGKMDIDLMRDLELINFVYSDRGRKVPKKVKNNLDMLDREEIEYCCKVFWMCGKWVYNEGDDEITVFNLFKSMNEPLQKMVEVYIELINKYPFYMVESSFMTFLQRLEDIDEQQISGYYKKVLKIFKSKSGDKVKKSVLKYVKDVELEERLRFLNLLLNLR